MNEVPLIQDVRKNDINTSIIAIKKQLKELNAMLGLIDVPSNNSPDMSPYVRKDEVVDAVKRFIQSPVTSNAVAESLSYSTTEQKTGGVWIDGKPVYRKSFSGTSIPSDSIIGYVTDCDEVISILGAIKNANDGNWLPVSYSGVVYCVVQQNINNRVYLNGGVYSASKYRITIEYTKTTD